MLSPSLHSWEKLNHTLKRRTRVLVVAALKVTCAENGHEPVCPVLGLTHNTTCRKGRTGRWGYCRAARPREARGHSPTQAAPLRSKYHRFLESQRRGSEPARPMALGTGSQSKETQWQRWQTCFGRARKSLLWPLAPSPFVPAWPAHEPRIQVSV